MEKFPYVQFYIRRIFVKHVGRVVDYHLKVGSATSNQQQQRNTYKLMKILSLQTLYKQIRWTHSNLKLSATQW